MYGQLVKVGRTTFEISLSKKRDGMYFIIIEIEAQKIIFKAIKNYL